MRTKPDPKATAFGINIGKKVFHVVALSAAGAVILRAKFSRDTLLAFFEAAPKIFHLKPLGIANSIQYRRQRKTRT